MGYLGSFVQPNTQVWQSLMQPRILMMSSLYPKINEGNIMKRKAHNHVKREQNQPDGATVKPTGSGLDELVTEAFEYDGGRQVTVYIPQDPPEAIVFASDGHEISKWGRLLDKAHLPPTIIVGIHRAADEMQRLHEYSPGFAPEQFAAHEKFFVDEVRRWTQMRFGVALSSERTAVFGVSAGRKLALALGLRHPMSTVRSSARRPAAVISVWCYAQSASAHIPRGWHTGALFSRERKEVVERSERDRCRRRHE